MRRYLRRDMAHTHNALVHFFYRERVSKEALVYSLRMPSLLFLCGCGRRGPR